MSQRVQKTSNLADSWSKEIKEILLNVNLYIRNERMLVVTPAAEHYCFKLDFQSRAVVLVSGDSAHSTTSETGEISEEIDNKVWDQVLVAF